MENVAQTLMMYNAIRTEQERRYAKLEREQHARFTQTRGNSLRRLAQGIKTQMKALTNAPMRKPITPSSTAAR